MSNPSGEGEGREGSGTCSEIQEIDALGAAGQDDVELVAGPDLADQGKNPFTLDSKEPTGDYQAFIKAENRYASLAKMFPAVADGLFAQNEVDAKNRYLKYKTLAD